MPNLTIGELKRVNSYQNGGSESGTDVDYIAQAIGENASPVQRNIVQKFFGQAVDARDYGVMCDGTEVFDGATTATSYTITSATGKYTYSSADMGYKCYVISMGNDVVIANGTIVGGADNTIQLSNPALYTGTNLRIVIVRTDDTLALNNLITDVSDAGGGLIMIPRGVLTATQIIVKRKVFLCGDGQFSTKLFQMENSNKDFIVSENYNALTGTGLNYGPTAIFNGYQSDARVPSTYGLLKMTIDGSWTLQGAANNGICFYGNAQYIDEVEVMAVAGDAIRTEASSAYAYNSRDIYAQEEGYFGRIFLRDFGVTGWRFRGPHDSEIDTVTIYDSESRSTGWAFIMESSANYIGAGAIKVIHAYPGTGNISIGGACKIGTIYNDLGQLRFTGSNTCVDKVFCLGAGYNGATPCIDFQTGIANVTISNVVFNWYWGTIAANSIGVNIPSGAENISILNFVGSKFPAGASGLTVYKNRGNFNRIIGNVSGCTGTNAIGADLGGSYCAYDLITYNCTNHIRWENSGSNFHNYLNLRAYRSGTEVVIDPSSKAFGIADTVLFDGTEQRFINAPAGSATYPGLTLGGDITSGWYRPGAGRWRYNSAGTDIAELNASGLLNLVSTKRVVNDFTVSTTTLATATGLSVNLEINKTYRFRAVIYFTADAVGGHKYAIAGTAGVAAVTYQVTTVCNATGLNVITSRQTALGGAGVGQAGCVAGCTTIEGTITTNAAGTLTAQFAQNATGGTSSALRGSTLQVDEVS